MESAKSQGQHKRESDPSKYSTSLPKLVTLDIFPARDAVYIIFGG